MRYVMMYTIYDPDLYIGHRIKHIEATDFAHAEKQGWEFLDTVVHKGNLEYLIAENPSSYRIYDNVSHKRS